MSLPGQGNVVHFWSSERVIGARCSRLLKEEKRGRGSSNPWRVPDGPSPIFWISKFMSFPWVSFPLHGFAKLGKEKGKGTKTEGMGTAFLLQSKSNHVTMFGEGKLLQFKSRHIELNYWTKNSKESRADLCHLLELTHKSDNYDLIIWL